MNRYLLLLTLLMGSLQTAYAEGTLGNSESTNHAISAGSSLFPEPVQCNQTSQITQWNGTNWTCLNDNFYVPPPPPVYSGTPCAAAYWLTGTNDMIILANLGGPYGHFKRIPDSQLRSVGAPYTEVQFNAVGGSRAYLRKYLTTVFKLGYWHGSSGGPGWPVTVNSPTCSPFMKAMIRLKH